MAGGLPHDGPPAEFLHNTLSVRQHTEREGNQGLAPIMFRKLLSEYVLMTLTATS